MPVPDSDLPDEFGCEERQHQAKLVALRTGIDIGDFSGITDNDPFERVRMKFRLNRDKANDRE